MAIYLLSCLHFYHLKISNDVCGHCIQQCQVPVDSISTLL